MSLNIGMAFNLVGIIVGAVVAFIIVAALFPVIDAAAEQLQNATANSQNPLVQSLSPVVPYIIGVGLFLIIMFPIAWTVSRLQA